MKLKRYPDAVEAFNHAVDLAPRNGNFWNNLAGAYSEEQNYTMTLQTLEKQEQNAGPYLNDLLWYNLGNALLTVAASTRVGATAGRAPPMSTPKSCRCLPAMSQDQSALRQRLE
jgi:tetratricopeptide (TPR) repeat protein